MSIPAPNPNGRNRLLVAIVLAGIVPISPLNAGDQPVMLGFPVFVPESVTVPVQQGGEGGGYGGGAGVEPKQNTSLTGPVANTAPSIGRALQQATRFCDSLPGTEYTIDCLAYEYWEIQKQLPDYGEMSEVKAVLAETSRKLRKLAADNPSPTKRPARVSQGNRKFNRALVPVDRRKLPGLQREAAAIINNGATLLIRASGDSDRKRAQYQQIAKSMQTGAIMLRSL